MNGTEMRNILSFEDNLKVGNIVKARVTRNYSHLAFPAQIIKINERSFTVKGEDGIPHNIPRLNNFTKWSANNRVLPLK